MIVDKLDNTPHVSSNSDNPTQKQNDERVLDQPQPSYGPVNTQTLQNLSQNQVQSPFVNQNGQTIPVIVANNCVNKQSQWTKDINNIDDFTAWSIFSICCCCLFLGAFALIMSNKTKTEKRMGNLEGARKASEYAAVLNTISNAVGIVIIFAVISLEYIDVYSGLNYTICYLYSVLASHSFSLILLVRKT